jgi:hypothetical protein
MWLHLFLLILNNPASSVVVFLCPGGLKNTCKHSHHSHKQTLVLAVLKVGHNKTEVNTKENRLKTWTQNNVLARVNVPLDSPRE